MASTMLPFLPKWGQCGSILLENRPTRSLVARASQRSSFAVRKFRTASDEHCGQGYDWCVQTLLPDVAAPETHWNSLCELKLWTFEQEFCMVGGYMEDLTNHRTVKIGGGLLHGDGSFLEGGSLHGTIWYVQIYTKWWQYSFSKLWETDSYYQLLLLDTTTPATSSTHSSLFAVSVTSSSFHIEFHELYRRIFD